MKNKKHFLLLIILVIMITAFGCAQEPVQDETNPDIDQDMNREYETQVEKSVEGSFVGWIDSSSFEIMKDSTPYVIRTSDDVIMPDDALEGRLVRVTYITNDQGQNIIKGLEVIE